MPKRPLEKRLVGGFGGGESGDAAQERCERGGEQDDRGDGEDEPGEQGLNCESGKPLNDSERRGVGERGGAYGLHLA